MKFLHLLYQIDHKPNLRVIAFNFNLTFDLFLWSYEDNLIAWD